MARLWRRVYPHVPCEFLGLVVREAVYGAGLEINPKTGTEKT
jgi:hypothetical protein